MSAEVVEPMEMCQQVVEENMVDPDRDEYELVVRTVSPNTWRDMELQRLLSHLNSLQSGLKSRFGVCLSDSHIGGPRENTKSQMEGLSKGSIEKLNMREHYLSVAREVLAEINQLKKGIIYLTHVKHSIHSDVLGSQL